MSNGKQRFASLLLLGMLVMLAGCLGSRTSSPSQYTVVGTVKNARGNPVAGALVRIASVSTQTNNDGAFSITAPSGNQTLGVSAYAYADYYASISVSANSSVNVVLQDATHIPLTVGSEWVYRFQDTASGYPREWTEQYLIRDKAFDPVAGQEVSLIGGSLVWYAKDGAFYSNGWIVGSTDCSPMYVMTLPANLYVGARWSITQTCGNTTDNGVFAVQGIEPVSTPAGSFNAWKINTGNQSTSTTIWVVRGIGLVKLYYRGPTGETTMELLSYSIK